MMIFARVFLMNVTSSQQPTVQGGQEEFQSTPLNTLVGLTRGVGYFVKGGWTPQTPTNIALGHSTYDVEMPSQPSSRLCVKCHRGSVLGLILFIMYTTDLISLIESHGLCHHTCMPTIWQVYGSRRPAAVDALSSKISECVGAVASWMASNRVSLNCDKTEVVW